MQTLSCLQPKETKNNIIRKTISAQKDKGLEKQQAQEQGLENENSEMEAITSSINNPQYTNFTTKSNGRCGSCSSKSSIKKGTTHRIHVIKHLSPPQPNQTKPKIPLKKRRKPKLKTTSSLKRKRVCKRPLPPGGPPQSSLLVTSYSPRTKTIVGGGRESFHTTVSSSPSSHIYDAMLGEISDLIAAASEAQLCGRLKMASTYQLLAHARLIGLGKRFDRYLSTKAIKPIVDNFPKITNMVAPLSPSSPSFHRSLFVKQKERKEEKFCIKKRTGKEKAVPNNDQSRAVNKQISEAQAEALARILPNDVNLDNTMMEHLARAAMELHYKRTGRGNKHLQQQQMSEVKDIVCAATAGGVAWTTEEKEKCIEAAENYGKDNTEKIAQVVGRTEAEVRAHLRVRERVEKGLGVKKEDGRQGSDASSADATTGKDSEKGIFGREATTPNKLVRKSGGRTKKPPTRAMLTVSDLTFDTKTILSGSFSLIS